MAITVSGISCDEIVRNYGEGADLRAGVTSRKGLLCNWTDRFTVASGLLGLSSTTSVGGAITLTAPTRHPELRNCFCLSIEFEGVGKPAQGTTQMNYPKCIVWANYGSINFTWGASDPYNNIDPNTPFVYAEQEIDVGVEVISVPGRALKFSGDGSKLGVDFGLRIGIADIKITLHRVPYLPSANVLSRVGSINNATYLGVGAGKLLFNGVKSQTVVLSDGTRTQDLMYSFTARTQPWDYSYNAGLGTWDKVVTLTGSDFISRTSLVGTFPAEYSNGVA